MDCRRAATDAFTFTFTIIVDGGEVPIIQGFDTILHEGKAVPCIGLEPRSERTPLPICSGSKPLFVSRASRLNQGRNTPVSGTLHVIPSSAGHLHRIVQLDEAPKVDRLIKAVGGPIKLVPGFDSILRGGEVEPCLAFYCETNSENPPNTWANLLWLQALVRSQGFSGSSDHETLNGPVVVLWGDIEFLKSLDPLLAFLNQGD
jgi:hypothetical protein